MKTLGFELVDAGMEIAVGRTAPAGGRASAERLVPPGTVPALLSSEDGILHHGAAAEMRRMLAPRDACDSFWEEFSLQTSPIRQGGRSLTHSELVYHFLQHLVDGLPGVASEHESLAVALPATFFDGGDRSEEKLGILLGIVSDLELRLASVTDSACASFLDPAMPAPAHGLAIVVDLGMHAAVITAVEINTRVTRRSHQRLAGAGWLALVDLARRSLSARFLRQTSFDVSVDRRTEQEFHQQTLGALDVFTAQQEALLKVSSPSRERSITVNREALVSDLKPLAENVAQACRDFVASLGLSPASAPVYLTSRARHLCGLSTALRARGTLEVRVFTPGAAARGAAVLACERKPPGDVTDVPVEDSLVLAQGSADEAAAVRSAFRIHRVATTREVVPTHFVIDGIAHPLRPGGVRISAGGAGGIPGDPRIAVAPAGLGPSEVGVESSGGGWKVGVTCDGRPLAIPGAEMPLAAGDHLEVNGVQGAARLLFVRVAG